MRIAMFAAASFALLATPASAWTVTHERDRLTDRELTWASAQSGGATLLVGCLNGHVQPRLVWTERVGFGNGIGVSWRLDNGPVVMTTGALFSQDGQTLYAWPGTLESQVISGLRKGKRLRVQLGDAVLDFDLTRGVGWPQQWGKCG
ncbi:hypothetical protein ACKWRH_25385 [Bradyrhizobium sp. Pa8]|uniref:hypothetical protein n=1 Tax=Bradyrhizobium sp. Pa8 TaxID=3386552 RepID=UPI00403F5A72